MPLIHTRIKTFGDFMSLCDFLFINELNYLGGYLAKFEICPGKTLEGYVFIILFPKVKSNLYNLDYFFNKKDYSLSADNQYSYAVYQNNELVKGVGSNPFKLSDNRNYNQMNDATFFDSDGFSNLLKKIDSKTFLIISKNSESWFNKIGVFSFIFLFFISIILLGILIIYIISFIINLFRPIKVVRKIYNALQKKLRIINVNKMYLETKIRLAFLFLAVLICSVVTYFTVQNVNNNFNEKQKIELDKKMSQIVNEIEIGYQKQTESSINTLIKHLSNSYEVDINLYNTNGYLTQSGNTRIYNEGWFSNLMNPTAFEKLAKNREYAYKQIEKIGELKYISNYNAIFDENRKLIGYVHLPFFSQSSDLKKEFSKYLGDLLNITTLLMAISLIIATYAGRSLVRPLKIMTNSISQMKVGSENKPIFWNQKDEIGQLVDQYNIMLKKLELSTEKLAQSEREGAWKEMAKQVAHEIKNPLTPMKLHLQHLQMSINRNDENLIPKVKNISKILIEQIDQLSNMAEEFSSFAKMPVAVLELFDINSLLESSIDLFTSQSDININFIRPTKSNMVYIDKGQVIRVFNNILKNAEQAAIENIPCIIDINTERKENSIIIKFKDNGKGIDEDLKEKIFTPNFSTKTSGMGLGLSICKKIIESFNGEINFESEDNNGTTFFVILPIID
ncbi:MAG: HAMP domain-containing histidine kinase [Bacteroidetes bacterium]|nr:HAMP domain-containing histidine kinase [Bacteroidota bacterium]